MTQQATSCDLKDLVLKFVPESIGREIEKACQGIYPLQNVSTYYNLNITTTARFTIIFIFPFFF